MLAFGALPDSLFRRNAYGELWIIDAGSIRADQDSIHTVTQIMHPHASFRSADPVGIARMCRQLAIKRHGPFRRYIGALEKYSAQTDERFAHTRARTDRLPAP